MQNMASTCQMAVLWRPETTLETKEDMSPGRNICARRTVGAAGTGTARGPAYPAN